MSRRDRIPSTLQKQLLGEPEKIVQTFMSSNFSLQMLCLQKVITYHWIQFRKIHYLSYENFGNIFLIMDYTDKNLRVLVLFLYPNALHAAPRARCASTSISRGGPAGRLANGTWGTGRGF